MNKKIILNPIFPFYITELRTNDKSVFKIYNLLQLILLKKGTIYFTDTTVSNETLLLINNINLKKITKISNIEIIHLIFKENLLDNIILNNYEKNIINELKFNNKISEAIKYEINKGILISINLIFSSLLKEYQNKKINYHSIIRHKLMELFCILHRHKYASKIINSKKNIIDDIIDFINNNYSDDLSLNMLALKSELNPSYLSRMFKEKTGKNLFEYINLLRIQKSCSLLKNTDLSVLEISLMVGYKNLSFYNRYFKKILNISPTGYRKTVQ